MSTASNLLPDSEDAMSWHIGNHGFIMKLSARIPELISQYLREWIEQWLAASRLKITDIGAWAVHPGGPRVIDSVQESLGLSERTLRASRKTLHDFGNMSSPTVLFILERIRKLRHGGPIVLLAFGPGLTVEACLLGQTP